MSEAPLPPSGSEGQPAPLNPTARADVDRALANAGVQGDLNPRATEDVDRILQKNEPIKDPLERIKDELKSNWEKTNGSIWHDKTNLREDYLNFVYGDPTAPNRGEVPVTLEDRAKAELTRRFPDEDKRLKEAEKVKTYNSPYEDPAIRDATSLITTRTNLDSEVVKAAQAGRSREWNDAWYRANNRLSFQGWGRFVDQYPEKAQAYKDNFPPIKAIFEGRERARRYEEQQAKAEEQKALEFSLKDYATKEVPQLNKSLQKIGVNSRASIVFGSAVHPSEKSASTKLNPERWDVDVLEIVDSIASMRDKPDQVVKTESGLTYGLLVPPTGGVTELQEIGAMTIKSPRRGLHVTLVEESELLDKELDTMVKKALQTGVIVEGQIPERIRARLESLGVPMPKKPDQVEWSNLRFSAPISGNQRRVI